MKKLLSIFVIIASALILMTAISFYWLQTENGKSWIVEQIPKYAPGVSVSGLEGSIPNDIRLAKITFTDSEGIWLEIDNLHISWHPFSLLRGKWRIDALEVSRIHMLRNNISEKGQTAEDFSLPDIPDIKFKKIEIGEIITEPAVTGTLQRLTVTGGGDNEAYNLIARSIEGPETLLSLEINKHWDIQAEFSEAYGGLIGSALKLPAGVAINVNLKATEDEKIIKLTSAKINIGNTSIQGDASYDGGKISGRFVANVLDSNQFSAIAATELSGTLNADITISGSTSSPNIDIIATSKRLVVNNQELLEPSIKAKLSNGSVLVNATTKHENQPATIEFSGEYKDQNLDIPSMKGSYGPYKINGNLKTNFQENEFSTELELEPSELQGATISGNLKAGGTFEEFTGDISAEASSDNESLTFKSDLESKRDSILIKNITLSGSGIDLKGQVKWHKEREQAEGELSLSASDLRPLGRLLATPMQGNANGLIKLIPGDHIQQAKIDLSANSVRVGSTTIEALVINAEGNENTLSANAKMNGVNSGKPFSLIIAADGTRNQSQTNLNLNNLNGTYAGEPFLLQSPSRILISDEKTEISPTTLKISGGNIQLSATMQDKMINAELKTTKLQLEKLPTLDLPQGTLQAQMTVTGNMANPKAIFSLTSTTRTSDLPLALALKGNWQNKLLSADATLNSNSDNILSAKADLTAPFSLSPVNIGVSTDTPVKSTIKIDAPLTLINRFIYSQGMHIDGRLSGAAILSGKLGTPVINGNYSFNNVNFDHEDSGICLRNAKAQIVAKGKNFTLSDFTSAASTGRIETNASVQLDGDQALSGNISFNDFPLFCGGTAKGLVDGSLQASGTLLDAKIAGALTLGPLNVQLPGKTPGQVEIPKVKTILTTDKSPIKSTQNVLMLDITLNAPNRVFVRGRGLDSEFSGKLHITGTATSPNFEGGFKANNGRFTLLDRELKLTDASIQFAGSVPPSPFLNVTAESTVQNTTITASLSGSANSPDFSFSSTPSLPKDEILALLLFGRSLSSLTPFQAITLAQSVAELSGETSGPGILGTIRNKLGVDRLDVGTDANNDVTVGAGKYISDKIYVGVSQGATPEDRAVTTEIEVTPRISATTSLDAEGNQGVGMQWKYDY